MAQMFAPCSRCEQFTQVTFIHEFSSEYPCMCTPCLAAKREIEARWDEPKNWGIPVSRTNAANLDAFYIAAARGEDFETGEVVDRARFIAADRDTFAYGHPTIISMQWNRTPMSEDDRKRFFR